MGWRDPPGRRVVPFSRDRRRPPRWTMGLPPRRPRRWWRRLADPLVYLKLVIATAAAGLIVLPFVADTVNAVARPARAADGTCRVVRVIDGDTIDLWCSGAGVERARLTGFDAPELFSPRCLSEAVSAHQAKWALRGMIFTADELTVVAKGRDRYDRRLVALYLDGEPVAQRMIGEGHARAYDGGRREGWCA
jgi:endonuclease YncB( thermonuclease family)